MATHLGIRILTVLAVAILSSARGDMYLHYLYSDRSVVERETTVQLSVYLDAKEETQTVDYRVFGITAVAGEDFVAAEGTVTFLPGETRQPLQIQLLDDRAIEEIEELAIELLNPVPNETISTQQAVFKLVDDETGYAIGYLAGISEAAGFAEVKIRRGGDFDFASSVEAYTEAVTARPGIDYVEEAFTVAFPAGVSERTIRVRLLNDAEEDGTRRFAVKLRNGTGGVPISTENERGVDIYDNELGYSLVSTSERFWTTAMWEGGNDRLYLTRRGDYDVASTAVVTIGVSGQTRKEATPGVDFTGGTFDLAFAPGQTKAEIPVQIANDADFEPMEYFRVDHPTSVSDSTPRIGGAWIVDNELNPAPVTKVCLGVDKRTGYPLLPYGSLMAVTNGFLVRANSGSWYEQPVVLVRFGNDGSPDPGFEPIVLDVDSSKPLQVVETTGGKYLVLLDRTLRRYFSNGQLDTTFEMFSDKTPVRTVAETDGRIYVLTEDGLIRLEAGGSVDETFHPEPPPAGVYIDGIAAGPAGSVYVKWEMAHSEGMPQSPFYARLTETGAVDPTFVPAGFGGTGGALFEHKGELFIREFNDPRHFESVRVTRVLPSGTVDPKFEPLLLHHWRDVIDMDAAGNFYVQRITTDGLVIERYTHEGELDITFWRIQTDLSSRPNAAVSLDGSTVMFLSDLTVREINGVDVHCVGGAFPGVYSMARLDLRPIARFFMAPSLPMLERESGAPDVIPLMRSGPNAESSATVRYRVRDGSAVNGRDFELPVEGTVQFAPGVSRVLLPVTIVNNSIAERTRSFFVDLVDEAGAVTATSEIQIINDDWGMEVLGIENNRLRVRVINGDPARDFDWMVSSDLTNWEAGYITYAGAEVEIDLTGGQRFIRGGPTNVQYGTSPWDSPVFTRR